MAPLTGASSGLAVLDGFGLGLTRVVTHGGIRHQGRAATRDLVLGRLIGDFVWFRDSEMVPAPDALEQHPALIGGQRRTSQGRVVCAIVEEAPRASYLNDRAYHGALTARLSHSLGTRQRIRSFVRRMSGVWADLRRFVGYGGEDFDFAYRLERLSGEPIVHNAKAVASTVECKSVEHAISQFEEYGATNLHLLEALHPEMPRTFELQRLEGRSIADRLFVAALSPLGQRAVDILSRVSPSRLRNWLLNYKVIAAVLRGYRSDPERRPGGDEAR